MSRKRPLSDYVKKEVKRELFSGSNKKRKMARRPPSSSKKPRVGRYYHQRLRRFKTFRVPKRIRRKRRFRSRRTSQRQKAVRLLTAVQPINTVSYQTAQTNITNTYSTAVGLQCSYILCNTQDRSGAASTSFPCLLAPNDLLRIANLITSSPSLPNIKFFIHSARMMHTLINQTSATSYVSAYYCMIRRDLPISNSLLTILTDGFNGNGLTAAGGQAAADVTPFQSSLFCSIAKIYKVQHHKFEPGEERSYMISSNKRRQIDTSRFTASTSGAETFLTVPIIYDALRGNRFILFRIRGQIADDSAAHGTVGAIEAKYNIATRVQYKYQWINDVTRTLNTLPATGFGTITGVANIVNVLTGAVGAQVEG